MDWHTATRRLHRLADAVGIQVTRAHPHMLRHIFVTTQFFDARRKLRAALVANGYMSHGTAGGS
jgi:integrase/recombinase XerD